MSLYVDTAYIAKCYINEPDAGRVRKLLQVEADLCSSLWCLPELASVFQRHVREGNLTAKQAAQLWGLFQQDVEQGIWNLLPVSDPLLRRVAAAVRALPPPACLRGGDAVHLTTAREHGFAEIYTNDRRMLEAAPFFGLRGRS